MSSEENMINDTIRRHLKQLVKTAGLPDTEESRQSLEDAWLDKMNSFDSEVESRGMELADTLPADYDGGAMIMTYSGSLITVGPMTEDGRSVEYRSIGIRNDVPASAEADLTNLSGDVEIDASASFTDGPIEKSSPVFRIALINEEMEGEEQEELLTEVTKILTESFVDVNKTIIQ